MEYNWPTVKVDWRDAGASLRVQSFLLVSFRWQWRNICKLFQPMGSKGRPWRKCPKLRWPIRSKDKCAHGTSLTLSSQTSWTLARRNTFILIQNQRSSLKFKNQPRPLFRPRSINIFSTYLKYVLWPSPFNEKVLLFPSGCRVGPSEPFLFPAWI